MNNKKILHMATVDHVPLSETNSYRRFSRIPKILSTILGMVWFIETTNLLSSGLLPRHSIGASILVCIVILAISLLSAFVLTVIASAVCTKARLRSWLLCKFSSPKEASKWMQKTDYKELDYLCGLDDDSWVPDLQNGGEKEPEGN